MWRFVLIAFIAMGWSFYELSGGSDYEPSANSLQAHLATQTEAATEDAVATLPQAAFGESSTETYAAGTTEEERARSMAAVEQMMERLGSDDAEEEDATDDLTVTLAAARSDAASIIRAEAERPKAELLQMQLAARDSDAANQSIDDAIAAAMGQVVVAPDQVRWVNENVVELRTGPGLTFDSVARITRGTEVGIIEDPGHGWIKVQVVGGYQAGWLAEWLVKEPELPGTTDGPQVTAASGSATGSVLNGAMLNGGTLNTGSLNAGTLENGTLGGATLTEAAVTGAD